MVETVDGFDVHDDGIQAVLLKDRRARKGRLEAVRRTGANDAPEGTSSLPAPLPIVRQGVQPRLHLLR